MVYPTDNERDCCRLLEQGRETWSYLHILPCHWNWKPGLPQRPCSICNDGGSRKVLQTATVLEDGGHCPLSERPRDHPGTKIFTLTHVNQDLKNSGKPMLRNIFELICFWNVMMSH